MLGQTTTFAPWALLVAIAIFAVATFLIQFLWVKRGKVRAEQQAWDTLRSMTEILCAMPDKPDLRSARVLARTELDHRIADWNAKLRAAYGNCAPPDEHLGAGVGELLAVVRVE